MIFDATAVRLKDGRTAILRPAGTEDARALAECQCAVAEESRFLDREPGELRLVPELEQEIIEDVCDDPRGALLLAFVDGALAGSSSLSAASGKRRCRHRCALGVALRRRFCGLGLGRAMLERALALAKDCGYEQAELEVAADNAPAIALYEKLGFETYGCRPHDMKYPDGSYADALLMAKRL